MPVDRPTATDCNAAARANIAILSCLEGNAIPEPICHGCALKILLLSLALREGQGQLRKHAGEEFDNNLELFNWLRHRQLPLIDPKRHLYLGYCSKYQNHLRHWELPWQCTRFLITLFQSDHVGFLIFLTVIDTLGFILNLIGNTIFRFYPSYHPILMPIKIR